MNEELLIQVTNKIFNLVSKKHTLQDIIDLGANLLGTDVSLFDTNTRFKVVSNKHSYTLKDINYIQEQDEFLLKLETVEDNRPFIFEIENNKRIIVSKSYYSSNYLGHISIPELNSALENINYEVVKLISDACAMSIVLLNNQPELNNLLETENAVFDELINGKYKTLSEFTSSSKFFSFKDYNQFSTICIIAEENKQKIIQKELLHVLKDIKCGFWNTIYNDDIASMIGWKTNTLNLKEITINIEKVCIDNNVIVGIGDPFNHLMQTRQNYANAKKATVYGQNDDFNRNLFYYDDYKFNVFISDMNLYINNSLDYISFIVMDILKHDQKYNTEYASTLKTFLSTSLSPQATADILFIHKNTVIYRINKIKELFNIDFTNTTQNFQFYFSFQLLAVRGWVKTD